MTAAEQLAGLVAGLLDGELPVRIRAWDGSEAGPPAAPTVHLTSRHALRRLVWQPNELGLAQAYVTGELDVPGPAVALSDGLRRMWQTAPDDRPRGSWRKRLPATVLAARLGAFGPRPSPPRCQARLHGRAHTTARDRAAIAHHYDLSNELYALILDESMAYSCAYYPRPDMSLAEAQRAKLDLICRKLVLRPGQRLLDVGCGWGSLLVHAAERYGVTALGVTISEQQREYVLERVAERGLSDRVEVRVQDYRTLREPPFDAVASIEMGEHVGQANYPVYAATLFAQLAPGGKLLLQQMSRRADAAPGGGAFIEAFIAPDMHMRPLPETLGLLQAAGLEIREVRALREHYVRTVADWLAALEDRYEQAVALVGEQVARVWRLYLVGGGLAFEQGRMGVDQILATRAGTDDESTSCPAQRRREPR
ncbi:MAG: class I SAM-dependent methyltransferase [Sciscionella sp.]